jgi:glycosyltransferase involved in cell wall biosynthesis
VSNDKFISVVIPNHNGEGTIFKCLESAFSSEYNPFEVVVVDDSSTDNSVEIIEKFPCKLVRLEKHAGVSKARNIGAGASRGELLFFIDNDCLLQRNTLALANKAYDGKNGRVIGGTYTCLPYDKDFFSVFQSVFVNHFETKKSVPDYIAAHSMIIDARVFKAFGGFVEDYFIGVAASVEDVEFSHRLRRGGYNLDIDQGIQVQHIFNFSFLKSMMNASKKSRYWTMYSLKNKDVFSDSGTASIGLKVNVMTLVLSGCLFILCMIKEAAWPIAVITFFYAFNLYINREVFLAFFKTKGFLFSILAMSYYALAFAAAVGAGALFGAFQYLWSCKVLRKYR